MTPTDRIGDFGHVDVTVRVHRNAVGRNELPGTFALFVRSKATHHLAFQVINGDTVPEARGVIDFPLTLVEKLGGIVIAPEKIRATLEALGFTLAGKPLVGDRAVASCR